MKVTQMPPVHAANLVANSGNTTYGVDVIVNIFEKIYLFFTWSTFHNMFRIGTPWLATMVNYKMDFVSSESGACLNIEIPSYQYRNPHIKDKTVLSLTSESPYLGKTVFILRWGLDLYSAFVNAVVHAVSHYIELYCSKTRLDYSLTFMIIFMYMCIYFTSLGPSEICQHQLR